LDRFDPNFGFLLSRDTLAFLALTFCLLLAVSPDPAWTPSLIPRGNCAVERLRLIFDRLSSILIFDRWQLGVRVFVFAFRDPLI